MRNGEEKRREWREIDGEKVWNRDRVGETERGRDGRGRGRGRFV
jgi:hypothetical protein